MSQPRYNSFNEFWPYYLAEHSKPGTRLLHLMGTSIALIPGYGAAWIGHFFIEKNKPATFQYPLWSFMGDYKMIWLMLTGRIGRESSEK